MSLVYVCVDCLREDVLASTAVDTPFLDGLRSKGLVATDMHATTTTTTPAVASVMTGRYSERNGVQSLRNVDLDDAVTTLSQELGAAGYDTAAYVTGPLLPETGLDRGFDTYDWRDALEETVYTSWFEDIRERFASVGQREFLYLHLWELHHPIRLPDEFDYPAYGHTAYERALSALDRKLEELYDSLPEGTTFVLTGDHGESVTIRNNYPAKAVKMLRDKIRFGYGVDTRPVERVVNRRLSRWGDGPKDHFLEDGHGQTVYDFTTNVPFTVAGPDVPTATVDAQSRQIDVFPTILDLLGVEDGGERDGDSLLPPDSVRDRPAYIRGCGESLRGRHNWIKAVRVDGYKYIEFPNQDWASECYDLDADPWELHELPADSYDPERFRAHFPTEGGESRQIDIDDHLEDLGYL